MHWRRKTGSQSLPFRLIYSVINSRRLWRMEFWEIIPNAKQVDLQKAKIPMLLCMHSLVLVKLTQFLYKKKEILGMLSVILLPNLPQKYNKSLSLWICWQSRITGDQKEPCMVFFWEVITKNTTLVKGAFVKRLLLKQVVCTTNQQIGARNAMQPWNEVKI